MEQVAFINGYDSFFSISESKRGYSGVATFCKRGTATPFDAGEGFDTNVGGGSAQITKCGEICKLVCTCSDENVVTQEVLDMVRGEGRAVITDHGAFVLINVYVPAVSVEDRVFFKQSFLSALESKACALNSAGRKVVIAGDFNICPDVIDRAEPVKLQDLKQWRESWNRRWLQGMKGLGYRDSFRHLFPGKKGAYSCWSTATGGRANNYGVRIDLILVSAELVEFTHHASVLSEVEGSDHCPVVLKLADSVGQCAEKVPKFAVKFMKRFRKRQTCLSVVAKKKRKVGVALVGGIKKVRREKQMTLGGLIRRPTKGGEVRPKLEFMSRSESEKEEVIRKRKGSQGSWHQILTGPPPTPKCRHGLPCVVKAVNKAGENRGRTFFSCRKPAGIGRDANCGFFKWAPYKAGFEPSNKPTR